MVRRNKMYLTVWDVIKRFLIGWGIALMVLVIFSCVKYWDFITTAFSNNIWAWINAMMPAAIILGAFIHIIKEASR